MTKIIFEVNQSELFDTLHKLQNDDQYKVQLVNILVGVMMTNTSDFRDKIVMKVFGIEHDCLQKT